MSTARRVGDYELIDLFAVGGAAQIFRARSVITGDIVVIKKLRTDVQLTDAQRSGFQREMALSLLSQHKNLIRGLDRGILNGTHYVVLEFVDGQDLRAVLDQAQALGVEIPLPFRLYLLREILDGLAFVHTMTNPFGEPLGLVHRDLSPANIFIRYDGHVRIGDFGASIATLQDLPAQEVVGSPGYLSPEQARLEPLDGRSDQFAIGCIMVEMLSGKPAFDIQGKSDTRILKMHRLGEILPLPKRIHEPLRLIAEIACSPEKEDRYRTAAMMRDAIDAHLGPLEHYPLGIASLTRHLFRDAFAASRLDGTPLTF